MKEDGLQGQPVLLLCPEKLFGKKQLLPLGIE